MQFAAHRAIVCILLAVWCSQWTRGQSDKRGDGRHSHSLHSHKYQHDHAQTKITNSASVKQDTNNVTLIVFTPSPSKNHRSFFQWNHYISAFQQLHHALPENSNFVSNPNFFQSYRPISDSNPYVDYSQGQSTALNEIFANKTNGFYIDLATNHWETGSNTFALEIFFNWTGICIEPNQMYAEGILGNRKCTLIMSPVYYENNIMVKFHMAEGLGGIIAKGLDNERASTGIVDIATVTLNSIVHAFAPKPPPTSTVRVLDYLSLDVEGAEFDAIAQFDFAHTIFHVISVERPKDVVHDLLIRNGYWFLAHVWRSEPFGEMIYLHHTCPRFTELMDKYRAKPQVRYNHNYKWHHPTYLLRPVWPLPSANHSLSDNALLTEDDIFRCGSRQLYLYKGQRSHVIPDLDVFKKIGDGNRDFNAAINLSAKFCAKLIKGKPLDVDTAGLPSTHAFWTTNALTESFII
jgi:hypothetical protein